MEFLSCQAKQAALKAQFSACPTPESRYQLIIAMGRALSPLDPIHRTPAHLVAGCQSQLWLYATRCEEKIYFTAYSEALISAGLAALLIAVYSGEPPEAILKCPPLFLQELGITTSLTPGRSHGLASLFFKMQQAAIQQISGIQNKASLS